MKSDFYEILKASTNLSTERLLLRRFTLEDGQDVYEYASDETTIKYLAWEGVKDQEEAYQTIISFYLKTGVYALELKQTGQCIGCLLIDVVPEHEKASLGYVLNRNYWNCGLMPEAISAVLELAFQELELNRVEATHYVGNEGSGRVMEKCGMLREGLALQEVKIKGEFRDVVHYGITRNRWISLSNKLEKNMENKDILI